MGQGLAISWEDLTRMPMQWEPTLEIFRIFAEFLDAKRAVVAPEDIDAMVASRAIEREYDKLCHVDSRRTRNLRAERGLMLGLRLSEGSGPTGAGGARDRRLGGPCLRGPTRFHGPLVGFAPTSAGNVGPLCIAEGGRATSLGKLQGVGY
jgi:hypothetical protein